MSKLLGLVCMAAVAAALNNGLGRTPQMGYNTWYDLMDSAAMNASTIRATADALISTGLHKLGYTYINLDDCWAAGRFPNGTVYTEESRFPGGTLKSLADYVHSLGLKFGTYTDRGSKTCAGRPGSQDYEAIDAHTYASWGVDYVKEDSCYASSDHNVAFTQYAKMRDALNATGRPIFFSLCGWEEWYAPVGYSLGNSWRIGPDDTNWAGVISNININANLANYSRPGGWNDPCLLLAETWNGQLRMTHTQTRTQFNFWAIMASPLLISANIRTMSAENLETYSNAEVIAIDQDPLGHQGMRLVGGSLWTADMAKPRKGRNGKPVAATADPILETVSCNASAVEQHWSFDKPAAQYIQHDASGLCFNVDDCGTDLILFSCVTSGGTCCGPTCYKNMQFVVSPNGTLTSPVQPGLCAEVSSGSLTLKPCAQGAVPDAQYFSYDSATKLLHQGRAGASCVSTGANTVNVWGRQITTGWAVLFVNTGAAAVDIACDAGCFAAMGFAQGKTLAARDVWTHTSFTASSDGYVAQAVPADGGSQLITFQLFDAIGANGT